MPEFLQALLAPGDGGTTSFSGTGPVGLRTGLMKTAGLGAAALGVRATSERHVGDRVESESASRRAFDCQRFVARRRTAGKPSDFFGSDVSHTSPPTLQFRYFGCCASQRTLRFRHWLQASVSRIGLLCDEVLQLPGSPFRHDPGQYLEEKWN
jgi:hypothetical protein